jgi:hypothetical protein
VVSLEERMEYVSQIQNNHKLRTFYDLLFLNNKSFKYPENLNETDQIFFGVIHAILDNDKEEFGSYFEKISKRIPNRDSPAPFIYDDLLIFSLILGIVKFGVDRTWIQEVMSVRNRSTLTITFQNIINDDYYSNSNSVEIVVAFLSIINIKLLTDDFLNRAYSFIVEQNNIFEERNDIKIISCLKSFDTIIKLKSNATSHRLEVLDNFVETFKKRIGVFSDILYNLLIFLLMWLLYKYIKSYPEIQDQANIIGLVFGIVGFSILNLISSLKNNFRSLLLYLLGYPKDFNK